MTTDVQAAQDLYGKLKPTAIRSAREYVMSRTPARLQDEMAAIIDADIAPNDPPTVLDAPLITQTGAGVASTLNCTLGNWNGAPTSRTYQWRLNGANVGTNSPTYTVAAPDIGKLATCLMTATNSFGTSGPTISNTITVA
jgi:hypothetical protein